MAFGSTMVTKYDDGLMFCEVFQCTVSGRRPLSSIVHGGGKLVLFDYCSV